MHKEIITSYYDCCNEPSFSNESFSNEFSFIIFYSIVIIIVKNKSDMKTSVQSNFADISVTIKVREKQEKPICCSQHTHTRSRFLRRLLEVLEKAWLGSGNGSGDRHIAEAVEYLWYLGHYLCVERGPL